MGYQDDLNNPALFEENEPGQYSYTQDSSCKAAYGQLRLSDSPERDPAAQAQAGGESRRQDDEGGHMIGARFGGAPGEENLTAQNRNLNRSAYKKMENEWAESLEKNDKVFVRVESHMDGSERPTSYSGYYITEHTDEQGNVSRESQYFSFINESRSTLESWDAAEEAYEAEHPESVGHDTTAPFHYDEETDEIVENPYYNPGAQGKESYLPEETQGSAEESASDYLPEGEDLSSSSAESGASNESGQDLNNGY